MNRVLATAIQHWSYVAPIVRCPANEKECNVLVEQLDELLDIVGEDEKHPLMSLIDVVSYVIASYEKKHYTEPMGKGVDALMFLMELHHLRQDDLPEIGSQGVVSEILCGKRLLNLRQIKLLAKRFKVEPTTFIDE